MGHEAAQQAAHLLVISVSDRSSTPFKPSDIGAALRVADITTQLRDEWVSSTLLIADDSSKPEGEGRPARGHFHLTRNHESSVCAWEGSENHLESQFAERPSSSPKPRPVAPFCCVEYQVAAGRIDVLVDEIGLRQVFWTSGDGWAAFSTSARGLARLSRRAISHSSLGSYSLLGHYLGRATSFRDVQQLGPGARLTLRNGRADVTPGPTVWPIPRDYVTMSLDERVQRTSRILANHMTGYRERFGEVHLELSGGMDSRTMLAAMNPSSRNELKVVTLQDGVSGDAEIASELCRRYGMEQQIVDLHDMDDLTPTEIGQLVSSACVRYECGVEPLARAVIDWAESFLPKGARVHGVGGEVSRGFYYSLQPRWPRTTGWMVDQLAKWRMFPNGRVDPACLHPDFREYALQQTLGTVRESILSYDKPWLPATDEFYLRERMCRWAGATYSPPATERIVLSPLFDPEYITLAHSSSPSDKSSGKYLARVLMALDSDLADLPLVGGRIPRDIGMGGSGAAYRALRRNGQALQRKVRQRMTGRERPSAGTHTLVPRLLKFWRDNPDALAGLDYVSDGILNRNWIDLLLDRRSEAIPSVATLGFCANLNEIGNVSLGCARLSDPEG